MNIKWNSYPNNLGHPGHYEGCFRCHNQRMKDKESRNLTQDCDSCHKMVVDEQTEDEWKGLFLHEAWQKKLEQGDEEIKGN